MDWTKSTNDPQDLETSKRILSYLKEIREFQPITDKEYVIKKVAGKRVLDIGIAEHALSYIDSKNWKHAYISKSASYCLGIDIIETLVEDLKKRGYNVLTADATSDDYLGEKFDIINIGDVIEHVNDPVKLLNFAKRHLNIGGEILVSTPNPYYYYFIYRQLCGSTYITNFEHTAWITPVMALELGRRSGLYFQKSIFFTSFNSKQKLKTFLKRKFPEIFQQTFMFEYSLPEKSE